MAVDANTVVTYRSESLREDLADYIANIDPTYTPVYSGIRSSTATATNHEWTLDNLRAPNRANKRLSGDDATISNRPAPKRRGNYCQISDEVPSVSGTQEVVDKAGRGSEMDYQVVKAGYELRRDIEDIIVSGNQVKDAGAEGTARAAASLQAWIATNVDQGATGTVPSGVGEGTAVPTAGTDRDFAETQIESIVAKCFDAGGDPDMILLGATYKQALKGFTGYATRVKAAEDRALVNAIDVYDSDFGDLECVPTRFIRRKGVGTDTKTDIFLIDRDMWAIAFLREFYLSDLAKSGDSEKKQLLCEWTLEACQEASSGAIYDLN